MKDPIPQFTHLINQIKPLKLAYLHVVESRIQGSDDRAPADPALAKTKNPHPAQQSQDVEESLTFAFNAWGETSPIFLAGGFKPQEAKNTVDAVWKDKDVAIVFGRYWISNPDLVFKIKEGIELNKYDRSTFYKARSTDGYTDYAFCKEFEEKANL